MSDAHVFAVGDTCYLRSGSPRMVVVRILEPPNIKGVAGVEVAWNLYGSPDIRRDVFPMAALSLAHAYNGRHEVELRSEREITKGPGER